MVTTLTAYLAQDRCLALVRGQPLPDPTHGSALFADISGFTSLTERFTHQLGARRSVEELTKRINAVYDAIIAPIEQYNGSVVNFAGDAITCWFDATQEDSSLRAVTSALVMQAAMRAYPDLSLKVAVTTGPDGRVVAASVLESARTQADDSHDPGVEKRVGTVNRPVVSK